MKWWKWLLWVVLVWLMSSGGRCDGCLEQEKAALLRLKPFFDHIDDLDKWVEGKQFENCCQWERVECNPITGRVIHLFLNQSTTFTEDGYVYIEYTNDWSRRDEWLQEQEFSVVWEDPSRRDEWYLNASLFLPFQELKSLYLNSNSMAGCLHNQGFERLSSKLDKLEILDLSDNYLNDSILLSLSKLSSLKSLYLGGNSLTDSNTTMNGIKKLSELGNLETLDLHNNPLLGNKILSRLDGFTSLKTLNLQSCGLKRTVHMLEFSNLMSLKELYLTENEIESLESFEGKEESRLIKLEVLGLSHNYLDNNIFSSLGALPNLKSLYLQDNRLTGPIDVKDNETEVALINLEVLDLRRNVFNDSILPYLGRLSNLRSLLFEVNCSEPMDIIRELNALSNLEDLDISCYPKACKLPLQSLMDMLSVSLKTLRLNGFNFNGRMTKKWQNLTSLEELYLEDLSLPSNFIGVIGTMTSLKVWEMDDCELNGNLSMYLWQISTSLDVLFLRFSSVPSNFLQVIGNLTSLRVWEMFDCQVTGNLSILSPFHLKNLESLDISNTDMGNNFLRTIGAMPSLNSLRLLSCRLSGTFPTQGFCESRHLRHLDISNNNLTGILPECFSNLTSLQTLNLSSNQFSGDISALQSLTSLQSLSLSFNQFFGDISAFKTLTSLRYLYLSSNQFSGDISALQSLISLHELVLSGNSLHIPSSLGPLFNLSKLKHIYADNNTVYAETKMPSLPPRFQLNSISLSCCGDGGSFPQFLYHQNELQSVDLSNILFKGDQFPYWLLKNNSNLETLTLANSSLSGPLRLPFAPHLTLSDLDISNNLFVGSIPKKIGAQLPSLSFLNMSKNYFNGSIPASIGDMNFLEDLDLSNNRLTGALPEHLAVGCSSLGVLILSNNKLEGQIFPSNFSLTNLEVLQLDGNNFTGSIPDCFSNCPYLSKLDVSSNQLYGEIPRWMGNMSSILELEIVMGNNHLEGPIPVEFCRLNHNLKLLDLSMNNISGSIPSCFRPSWITQVHLSRNKLHGPLTDAFGNSTILVTLDLSNNYLTGNIPNWIGNLSQLSYLLLNNNQFGGRIPVELCELTHLSLIDLSHNNLSGTIPPCLKITTRNDVYQDYVRYVADVATAAQAPGPSLVTTSSPTNESIQTIQFSTKNSSYSYKGRVLTYLSGIDLSCNKLTGQIPHEAGNFEKIVVLNLSHNSLTGPIPPTLSNLRQIESLDLSYNNLSGTIPPQLAGLTYLAWFSVAYNNLSGTTPERTAQFSTFEESSYLGNPSLCGPPLPKNCSPDGPSLPMPKDSSEDGSIDMNVFYVSFGASYVVVLLAIGSVLYINPYRRRAWFYHVETASTTCYNFLIDHLPKRRRCWTI